MLLPFLPMQWYDFHKYLYHDVLCTMDNIKKASVQIAAQIRNTQIVWYMYKRRNHKIENINLYCIPLEPIYYQLLRTYCWNIWWFLLFFMKLLDNTYCLSSSFGYFKGFYRFKMIILYIIYAFNFNLGDTSLCPLPSKKYMIGYSSHSV